MVRRERAIVSGSAHQVVVLNHHISAASMAMWVPAPPIAKPMSAWARAGASFDAIAAMARESVWACNPATALSLFPAVAGLLFTSSMPATAAIAPCGGCVVAVASTE